MSDAWARYSALARLKPKLFGWNGSGTRGRITCRMARVRDVPAVRILPMSVKREGFEARSIEDVQNRLFLRDLPKSGGRWTYPRVGLSAEPGTIVLFQYRARVIASAVFL